MPKSKESKEAGSAAKKAGLKAGDEPEPKRRINFDLSVSPKKKKAKAAELQPNEVITWGTRSRFTIFMVKKANGDSAYFNNIIEDLKEENSYLGTAVVDRKAHTKLEHA